MTMVCTGPICLKELQQKVCQHFSTETETDKSPIDFSNEIQSCIESFEYRFSGSELLLRDDDEELGYVAIGIEGPNHKQHRDHFVLNVAKEIVGSWDRTCGGANHNAPFIAHFAFNTNLCHMYKSFFHNWAHSTSIWGCYFVCDKLNLENMVDALHKEWMKLCTTITQKEVSRAINQCKMKELMILNNPVNRFLDIVKYVFRYGYYDPIQSRVLEYEKITADKIREVAEKYIYDQSPIVIGVGRIENLPSYYMIKNGLYLLRY